MKHRSWANYLLGAGFAFVLSVGAVGSLATGYDLPVSSMAVLILWCACFSAISAFLFRFKYGGSIWLCLMILVLSIVWKGGLLQDQLQTLSHTISLNYHRAYNWPLLGNAITEQVDLPLVVLSAWIAVSVSWTVCRNKHLIVAVPPVILPMVLCFLTTGTVPDAIYLYLVIFGIGLLLITDWSRRKHPQQGTRLTLRLTIPLAVAVALLFATNPSEGYVNNAGKYQKAVMSWLQQMQNIFTSTDGDVSFESATSQKLNLRNVGPKRSSTRAVMRVVAPIDGMLYLRGRDYDVYSGTGWEASSGRKEVFSSGGNSSRKLTVMAYGVLDMRYVPYYATEEIVLTDGRLANDENIKGYTYYLTGGVPKGTQLPDPSYTQLPSDTFQWASGLDIMERMMYLSASEKVGRIEYYVQNAATYDLSTPRMPTEYNDFAQWFLEESDTGYCVHFATAATVLLRAVGIPARYVEGYAIPCEAGKGVAVSNKRAHAWAEYYDSSIGAWRILEATPDDFQEEEDPTTVTTEDEQAQTEPSSGVTEPSAPETTETTASHTGGETQSPDQDDTQVDRPEEKNIPGWMKIAFGVILVMAIVPAQSYIRISRKQKQWNRGRSNAKAIVRWRQTKEIAHRMNVPYPEELELLAQKAKFSQHRIQSAELQLFVDYRETLLETFSGKPWYERLFLHWIFAIPWSVNAPKTKE